MRAVVQRVRDAEVRVAGKVSGRIDKGLLVYLGVGHEDTERDVSYLTEKIIHLRIFEDADDKMNLSLADVKGKLLVVSQFTLYGDCRKGKRPSWSDAARPEIAEMWYQRFIDACRDAGITVETGVFQAMMEVEAINEGPVTMLIDSKKGF